MFAFARPTRHNCLMKIEILCTGDEILTGKTVNTNYSHIARRLADTGLGVHWGTTVGDDRASLLQAFRQAGERADAVIVNGELIRCDNKDVFAANDKLPGRLLRSGRAA